MAEDIVLSPLKKKITLVYDPVHGVIGIERNDFTPVEALGVMHTAALMLGYRWMRRVDEQDEG